MGMSIEQIGQKLAKHIMRNGPDSIAELAKKLGVSFSAVKMASNCDWFDGGPDRLRLTVSGQQALTESEREATASLDVKDLFE